LTEELPPKALKKLGDAFGDTIRNALHADQFLSADSQSTVYATPRRLAVSISKVLERAPDKTEVRKLMPVSVATDANGQPTVALQKKLAAMNLSHLKLGDLYRKMDGKSETLYYNENAKGGQLK